MHRLGTYLPRDRLRALITGGTLPSRTNGAAVFADISGFTPLTEKLTRMLGPRKGVEAISHQLNAVYGALIDQVEAYGGHVITFAGDSIIGWFKQLDSASAALKAVSCAEDMQVSMQKFEELSLKIVVTSGPARRLVVGDPEVQRIDTLAGRTIARLSTGERLAQRGEILMDETTVATLAGNASTGEQRSDPNTAENFFVFESLAHPAAPQARSHPDIAELRDDHLRPWLLPPVYQREKAGLVPLLTELRPAVPLFISFSGIDYDSDPEAEEKLHVFVARLQRLLSRHEGALLQLVIGDKGSYIYAAFGVFTAHEDDAERAVYAALELRQIPDELPYIHHLQMGISLGTLRVGAYGNASRRTFAALGDDVNLAARLMTMAMTGEILIAGRVQVEVAETFTLEPRQPIPMKGKGEPQSVFAVTGIRHRRATRLPEPAYRLPMIGRQEELALVDEKLKLALEGQGQVIGITAEAGMGKSRLIAEVIRLARKRGFTGYGGACQSSGTNTPYLVWQTIWQAFFDLDPEMPQRKQMRLLEGELEDRVPDRVEALPLLSLVLDLPLPDSDFTRALEPKDRKGALEVLLEDCLRSAAQETPLLIVLEDLHWIDPLSHDLLEALARASESLRVCFVLAYRPPDLRRLQEERVEKLPHFTKIDLKDLTALDAEQLIRAKLAQLFPEGTGALPKALVDELTAKSEGNPFYMEELLNYLHDRGLNPYDLHAVKELELPASLQTLILSRIDQLTEPLRVTLKVASVIGRVFPFFWLHGYYPLLGDEGLVKGQLMELSKLDLTPLDTPDPELAYIFKHIVTQEVAYESLSYATRAQLHELLARFLEAAYPDDPPIEALTFHYSRSDNLDKKRYYLHRSGITAQAAYANETALEYYEQALASSPGTEESVDLHLNVGRVLLLMGERNPAKDHFEQALHIATASELPHKVVESEIRLGNAWTLQAEYPLAVEWLEKAQAHATAINDRDGVCGSLGELGVVYWRMADFEKASAYLQQSIELARQIADQKKEVYALTVLGQIKAHLRGLGEARQIFEDALALARQMKDPRRLAAILNNYATAHYYRGDYDRARALLEESLSAAREIGDKRGLALSLNNLGNIFYGEDDFEAARGYYEEALRLGRATEDRYIQAMALTSLGITVFRQQKLSEAGTLYQESLRLNEEMGDKVGLSLLHCYLGLLALAQGEKATARKSFVEGLTIAHQSDIRSYLIYNLIGLAMIFLREGKPADGVTLLAAAASLAAATGFQIESELREPYDGALAEARARLTESDFEAAWIKGKNMKMVHAVKFATEN